MTHFSADGLTPLPVPQYRSEAELKRLEPLWDFQSGQRSWDFEIVLPEGLTQEQELERFDLTTAYFDRNMELANAVFQRAQADVGTLGELQEIAHGAGAAYQRFVSEYQAQIVANMRDRNAVGVGLAAFDMASVPAMVKAAVLRAPRLGLMFSSAFELSKAATASGMQDAGIFLTIDRAYNRSSTKIQEGYRSASDSFAGVVDRLSSRVDALRGSIQEQEALHQDLVTMAWIAAHVDAGYVIRPKVSSTSNSRHWNPVNCVVDPPSGLSGGVTSGLDVRPAVGGEGGLQDGGGPAGGSGATRGSLRSTPDLGGVDFTNLQIKAVGIASIGAGAIHVAQYAPSLAPDQVAVGRNKASNDTLRFMLIGLICTDSKFWVNLNENEPNRVCDKILASRASDLAAAMLEADFRLKREATQMTHPHTETGRKYWHELGRLAGMQASARSRIWVVPGEVVFEADKSREKFFLTSSRLELRTEGEHFSAGNTSGRGSELQALEGRLLLPELTRRVNQASEYQELRNVFNGLAFATLLKQQAYRFRGPYHDLIGTDELSGLPDCEPWDPRDIWEQFVQHLRRGSYDIEETIEHAWGRSRMRYFAGGVDFCQIGSAIKIVDMIQGRDLMYSRLFNGRGFAPEGTGFVISDLLAFEGACGSVESEFPGLLPFDGIGFRSMMTIRNQAAHALMASIQGPRIRRVRVLPGKEVRLALPAGRYSLEVEFTGVSCRVAPCQISLKEDQGQVITLTSP